MAKPRATVDYSICDPASCGEDGRCQAVAACEHKVLEQEAPGESPFAFRMCLACGSCVTACPRQAIRLL